MKYAPNHWERMRVSTICVVHLVRKMNGLDAFRQFLDSYRRHPAGIDHDLLILYKGFFDRAEIAPYETLLAEVRHTYLQVADFGFDLRPYFLAAKTSGAQYLCFLNSFSIILDKDWLLKLHQHASKPGVGIAGATGSWGSIRQRRLVASPNRPLWRRLLRPLVWRAKQIYTGLFFGAFPNYHVRTNGFMIARNTFLKVRRGLLLTKMQMYRLESGKNSITNQVERMGLTCLVVGKDGSAYDKHHWHISGTFWRGMQEYLLIADNQTRKYDAADREGRLWLENFAWGTSDDRTGTEKSAVV